MVRTARQRFFRYLFVDKMDIMDIIYRILSGNNSVVEYDLAKVGVAGSNPVSRSIFFGGVAKW